MTNKFMTEHVLNMTPAWFAVYTRHQHEKVVANILVTKGSTFFCLSTPPGTNGKIAPSKSPYRYSPATSFCTVL